ncbi:hypothetical protein KCU81_g2270, partial [Aureobasidium melanogenum]|uniref:Uncharacterized protein n=1 Tax=Aureobasidium melanogenum (strain CBS 110374) TaxID=1043003 RepID=A0A074VWM9_AURM1
MESGDTTSHDQNSPSSDQHDEEEATDPQEEMDPFDWQKLETEYFNAMAQCKEEEDAHLQEFASLSQFFGVWAETISGHEQKRSHQRLRTQSSFVMRKEEELEERRKHYVQVVEAFRAALSMLDR